LEIGMPKLIEPPPCSPVEPITDVLHGVSITDPYRWLEDQDSTQTRAWLEAQTEYARAYLDPIPGRDRIRERIRDLLDVETYDSIQKAGNRYFFRKRTPRQEQPCIFLREGPDGEDRLLLDPAERGTGSHTAVKPLRISPDGQLLLYEVKEGGERTGTFELLDIERRKTLADVLPRGYLRGFAFAPDSRSFYYVHEAISPKPQERAVYHHVLGTRFDDDKQIFRASTRDKLRLSIVLGKEKLGILVYRFLDKTYTDLYLWPLGSQTAPKLLIKNAGYRFGPLLMNDGRILAITDREAPNSRIVEVRPRESLEPEFVDVVPEMDVPIQNLALTNSRILVSYTRRVQTQIAIFDLFGKSLGELAIAKSDTVRLSGGSVDEDELFFERESFTKPIQIYRYSSRIDEARFWAERRLPFDSQAFDHTQVWFTTTDRIRIPMFLVGRRDVLEGGQHPAIMTSYGGYGVPMTPQFSVFVAFLIEHGCLFALPNIRGGSEFGVEWHEAAKRRNRQVAFDDFIAAAEWLIETGRTESQRFAIFGGSNSGLLVGAAMTQRPDLFRAVVCMVPMLDMLRYHLFDNAHVWKEELGTTDDPDDFAALLRYSPYQQVREGVSYPATMFVSGDADQNCNSLHARKMTARLQAANVSEHLILLEYSRHRGHSPVLPLSERIEALTDRMAFLCDQLQLRV
jgi:prolyl oligopeptidase